MGRVKEEEVTEKSKKGDIVVQRAGRYWELREYFSNGGYAARTFPDSKSAHQAAAVLRRKGIDYQQGGKEADRIHRESWDFVEPRLARAHAKHAEEFLAKIPRARMNLPEIKRMKNAITGVKKAAKKGPGNAEQQRRSQSELFDAQFEVERALKYI